MDKMVVKYTQSEARLNAQEIHDFFEIGWITKKAMFRLDEVEKMKTCFDDLERMAAGLTTTGLHCGSHFVLGQTDGQQVIKRVVWAGGSQPYLLQVGADRRL